MCTIICEDDIKLSNKFCNSIFRIWKNLNKKYFDKPLILLLNNVETFYTPDIFDSDIQKANGRFFGTGAYMLNKKAVHTLLKYCYPIEVQVDSYIAFLAKLKLDDIHIFHTRTNLIDLQNIKSTIEHTDCKNCWLPKRKSVSNNTLFLLFVIAIVSVISIILFKDKLLNK
jgi:GR25 family glycosyltransferase involved in LPS biosynthesis